MSTITRGLPAHPHLDVPKRQARELLRQGKEKSGDAFARIRRRHPRLHSVDDDALSSRLKLSDAQLVIAREYGFASWAQLKQRITGSTVAELIDKAIRARDAANVTQLLTAYPHLLHVPVRSGNWGPPMSHAANLGLLDMVKVIAPLGAKDFQHAFDRALLHGDIDIAQWLHKQGAAFTLGVIMGCCETLNDRGFGFLDDSGIPLADGKGDPLAPLAMILETYSRNPAGKHAILQRFKARGYRWADTPIMAFHCGDLDLLDRHLQLDPQLLHRRFSYREIYPPELGCADDGRSGLHGTPIDGTTLLHLAIDFQEAAIFDWLLAQGANVNAAALVDKEGFGGHTPLYNTLIAHRGVYMANRLLEQGADLHVKVNMRKFVDWCEEPGWHIARNVTPLEWATGFREKDWVNWEAVKLIESHMATSR
jgi:ankyrin repeat protein